MSATETTDAFENLKASGATKGRLSQATSPVAWKEFLRTINEQINLPENTIAQYETLYRPVDHSHVQGFYAHFNNHVALGKEPVEWFAAAEAEKLLTWHPILIPADEEAGADVPMLMLEAGRYLSWFRGYRMQVSATLSGRGDVGSSPSSMNHDINALFSHPHYMSQVMLAHTCAIAAIHTPIPKLLQLLRELPQVLEDFFISTYKEAQNIELSAMPVAEYLQISPIVLSGKYQTFPIIGMRNHQPVFCGEGIIGANYVGFKLLDSECFTGYTIEPALPTCVLILKLYMCAIQHGLFDCYRNAVPDSVPGTHIFPAEYFFLKGSGAGTLYSNLQAMMEHINDKEHLK